MMLPFVVQRLDTNENIGFVGLPWQPYEGMILGVVDDVAERAINTFKVVYVSYISPIFKTKEAAMEMGQVVVTLFVLPLTEEDLKKRGA